MAKYGYIRLDEKDPDVARQASQLDTIGDFDKIFVEQEKKTNNCVNDNQLNRAIDLMKNGDVLFVATLDRLCSGANGFIEIVEKILSKNADLVCLENSFDTRNPAGKNTLKFVKTILNIEKENMSQKKKIGIKKAREKGKRVGRPPVSIPIGFRKICEEWVEGKITGVEAINRSGMKSTTFYAKALSLGYGRNTNKVKTGK